MTNLNSGGLSVIEAAQARHHTYVLFGRLLREGLSAELWQFVQAIPDLSAAIPRDANGGIDYDQAAADFQHLFGFNVFPHESIFIDEAGLLGGKVPAAVAVNQAGFGFVISPTEKVEADHIGQELAALAFLCGAEVDALEDDLPHIVLRVRNHQLSWLESHLLRWVWPLKTAVDRHASRFFSILFDYLSEMLIEHYAFVRSEGRSAPKWGLPAAPAILQDEKTGIKEISEFLTTPAYSGFYFSRDMIGVIARQLELPRGFGSRSLILTNLMRAAAQYDIWLKVLEMLGREAETWLEAYRAIQDQDSQLEPFVGPWEERLQNCVLILERLKVSADQLVDEQ